MAKRIKVKLNKVEDILNAVTALKKEVIEKNRHFVNRLTKDAEVTLRGKVGSVYGSLQLYPREYIERPEIYVPDAHVDNGKGVVVLEGKDAPFVEFGAGVFFNGKAHSSTHPLGNELGMRIGEFGDGNGQYPYWGYKDEDDELHVTRGTHMQMPLYDTLLETADKVPEIVREVWW